MLPSFELICWPIKSKLTCPNILHDALVGIVQGLGALLVDTSGGVIDERVALELELMEDLGTILQGLTTLSKSSKRIQTHISA